MYNIYTEYLECGSMLPGPTFQRNLEFWTVQCTPDARSNLAVHCSSVHQPVNLILASQRRVRGGQERATKGKWTEMPWPVKKV